MKTQGNITGYSLTVNGTTAGTTGIALLGAATAAEARTTLNAAGTGVANTFTQSQTVAAERITIEALAAWPQLLLYASGQAVDSGKWRFVARNGAANVMTISAVSDDYSVDTILVAFTRAGLVGFGNITAPTAMVDINSNVIRLRTAKTPASATAAGNAGDICWDSGNIYVCVATNTWKRAALGTW